MSEKPELLPCPFCGNKAAIFKSGLGYGYHFTVYCKKSDGCGGTTDLFHTEAEAIAAWNRRSAAVPDPRDAEIATLRAELSSDREGKGRLLGFLHRAFVQLNEMAGEGLSFTGQEDPADILFDYARSVGTPDDDMEAIMAALAARAALAPAP